MRLGHSALFGPLAIALAACTGTIDTGTVGNPHVQGVGPSGARRLTRVEYDNTVRDLLGDETRPGFSRLPEDVADPFDNDYRTQEASAALVEAAEALAEDVATRAMADPERRAAIVGCTPTGPDDGACLRAFIRAFGRRALRRPLTDAEVEELAAVQAFSTEAGDFHVGAGLVIRALLQDPEFLYRIEIGRPVTGRPGLYKLSGFEVATRLAYFLWGSTPDDALLDDAAAGLLDTPAGVRAAAARMLQDPRARDRIDRFHALWLGYYQLPHATELTSAMRAETRALVERVVFEQRGDYFELFRAGETFVNDLLADHYGLPAPGAPSGAWVPYDGTGRAGILSHGSFLSVVGKFGDTSPTLRGKLIRERLLCQIIPPPPPNVDVDEPPSSPTSNCKWDRYAAHRESGSSCFGCHAQMDPVGFGLENYDQAGRWRAHDNDAPECLIAGEGEVVGVGTFSGPKDLGRLLAGSDLLEPCVVRQVFRFAMGRREQDEDEPVLFRLEDLFRASGRSFEALLLDLVGTEAFGYRLEEEV